MMSLGALVFVLKTFKKTRLKAMALFFMLKNCYNNERKAYNFMKQQKYNFKDLTLAYFQKKIEIVSCRWI